MRSSLRIGFLCYSLIAFRPELPLAKIERKSVVEHTAKGRETVSYKHQRFGHRTIHSDTMATRPKGCLKTWQYSFFGHNTSNLKSTIEVLTIRICC